MGKKVIKMIVIAIVIVIVSLIGIFWLYNRKTKEEQAQAEQVKDRTDVTFEGSNMELGEVEGVISSYIQKNGKLYISTKESSEDEAIGCYRIYSMNIEDNDTECIYTCEGEKINTFCVDDNENIVYISEKEVEDKHVAEIVKIDKIENEIDRVSLGEVVGSEDIYLCGMLTDQDGQLVLACKDNIYFLDEQLQISSKVQPKQDYLVDIALAKTGQLVCVTDKLNSQTVSLKVSLLDPKEKQWGEDIAIKLDSTLACDYVMGGIDYDFCYKSNDGIYGYDIAGKEKKEIIDYDASYMINSDSDDMINVDNGKFVGKTERLIDNCTQITLVSYEKKDEGAVNNKQIITLGTAYPGNGLKSAIAKFNRSNSEYEIEIVDYSGMELERVLADFSTGKGQDIIDMNVFPLSVAECVSKGMVEDLTPYFEYDKEISVDDLLESVRRAMEYEDKLYYISSGFSVETIAARKEDVGDRYGWSVSDLKALTDKSSKNIDLFEIKNTKDSYLESLIINNLSDYIDWENGSCSFDSESFKYILELCNEKGMQEERDESFEDSFEEIDSEYSRFQNGEFLLLRENEIDLYGIQYDRKALDLELVYVGYPNEAKSGGIFKLNTKFALSSQSNHKEGAWEFIRTFLLKDYQWKDLGDCYMPVTQEMFEAKLKEMTATEPYINIFGEEVEPVEEYTVEWGDLAVEMGVPSQEDIDIYMDLINNTKYCAENDIVIEDIIMEEAQNYFMGRKKLDKTVEIIQDRVTTYINEKK